MTMTGSGASGSPRAGVSSSRLPRYSPRQDPELADAHRRLLPALSPVQPVPVIGPDQAPVLPAEPLSDREREVPSTASWRPPPAATRSGEPASWS